MLTRFSLFGTPLVSAGIAAMDAAGVFCASADPGMDAIVAMAPPVTSKSLRLKLRPISSSPLFNWYFNLSPAAPSSTAYGTRRVTSSVSARLSTI